jgi:hypothetical protein
MTLTHRLDGLEPDSLLAWLALLGALRALDHARPDWRVRASWSVDAPPLRPVLHLATAAAADDIAEAAAEGISALAEPHTFDRDNLRFTAAEARAALLGARDDPLAAALWSALLSDAAVADDGRAMPTPYCLQYGQGHQCFLDRLAEAPRSAPDGGATLFNRPASDDLSRALFAPWRRADAGVPAFRWDPAEDQRYALRATDPTAARTKERHERGANRLAAIGLPTLTVAPVMSGGRVRLAALGAERERDGWGFWWPVWRPPLSLGAIRSLLAHPGLDDAGTAQALGVAEIRRARRTENGKFANVGRGEPDAPRAVR